MRRAHLGQVTSSLWTSVSSTVRQGKQFLPQGGLLCSEWDKAYTVLSAVPGSVDTAIAVTSLARGLCVCIYFNKCQVSKGECHFFSRMLLFPIYSVITHKNNVTSPTCWSCFHYRMLPGLWRWFFFFTSSRKCQLNVRFAFSAKYSNIPSFRKASSSLCVVAFIQIAELLLCQSCKDVWRTRNNLYQMTVSLCWFLA